MAAAAAAAAAALAPVGGGGGEPLLCDRLVGIESTLPAPGVVEEAVAAAAPAGLC